MEKNISSKQIDLQAITHCFFIGIGGIGMSALARYFNLRSKTVCGYDKTPSSLTDALLSEGIGVHFKDELDVIPQGLKTEHRDTVLVIYTPAVPMYQNQLVYFRENNYTVLKRSEVLGLITNQTNGLAVAGTHGKTTTSTMLSYILHKAGYPVSAFLGGISSNFKSNFIHTDAAQTTVVEADEFDRSFLALHPESAIITSTDADHLDIYGEKDQLAESFRDFATQVKKTLIIHENCASSFSDFKNVKTYGTKANCDYVLKSRTVNKGSYTISIQTPNELLKNISLSMPGEHNALNATAAIALAIESGFDAHKVSSAFNDFAGISRRFEFKVQTDKNVYIDDYAHHPAELDAAISAARELYPDKKLTGVFQPHLFSRTRDFMDEFASSLSELDELILLEIYPAREEPISGITSQALLDKVTTSAQLLSMEDTISWVKNTNPELLMTLGAGDINKIVEPLKTILK